MDTSGEQNGSGIGNASGASATSSFSTTSSLNSRSSHDTTTEDDHTIAAILAEDENINNGQQQQQNRLGRRLSHLDSIPKNGCNSFLNLLRSDDSLYWQHTPRVNNEIPDANDATYDHERLSERLSTYGLAELQIEGDGNCQFRALADQLFRNPDYHKHVRKQVVKQLKRFKKLYESYVPMRYKDYLKKMKKLGEWGDHVTLQAAADRFGAKICLVTSFRDTCYIEILPKDKNPSREIWLSFWSEVHYNSLYETGGVPTRVPKKRHWLF